MHYVNDDWEMEARKDDIFLQEALYQKEKELWEWMFREGEIIVGHSKSNDYETETDRINAKGIDI